MILGLRQLLPKPKICPDVKTNAERCREYTARLREDPKAFAEMRKKKIEKAVVAGGQIKRQNKKRGRESWPGSDNKREGWCCGKGANMFYCSCTAHIILN